MTVLHPARARVGTVERGSAVHGGGQADSDSLADVIERLRAVFEPRLSASTVVLVVRRCRRELDIVSGPPLAELLERLARQRLTDLAAQVPAG